MEEAASEEVAVVSAKVLSAEEAAQLERQNGRLVSPFEAEKLEKEARKNWDLFYKRNETRFFKDRHWTSREFPILEAAASEKSLFEVGCGVGNFFFPLLQEARVKYVHACDFSGRAVDLVKTDPRFDPEKVNVFQADVTEDDFVGQVGENCVDIVTLIFVLSAIHPSKHVACLKNVLKVVRPGGVLLFRDYGLHDMAQLRFKPGHKIADNLYKRQDGTRSYYFSVEEVEKVFNEAGFKTQSLGYVHRRTVNKKESVDVPRIFVQAEFVKEKDPV